MVRLHRSVPYLAGLGLGLYLARVVAEATRVAWSLPALLALAATAAAAGLGLARFITRQSPSIPQELAARQAHPPPLWTALPLWLYVLWPRQDPGIAWGVGLTALIAWLVQVASHSAALRGLERGKFASLQVLHLPLANLPTCIFLTALIVYLLTLSPGLQQADGGEFQLVTARFGVAHPPGYPLYSLLGGLFVRLPLGPGPAWRLNLFSAITAAATLALVGHIARRMTGSAAAGMVAALTLGSATTFWATATTASIRPLTAFFTALALYALIAPSFRLQVADCKFQVSRVTFLAVALGLGLAHHASLAFFGAVCLVYLLLIDPSLLRHPRHWLAPVIALALTQLVWLYLPLRDAAGAPLAPGNLTTLEGLANHIRAQGFAGDMFAFATPEHLPDRLSLLPALLRFQFNPLLLGVASLGALLLLRRDWRRFTLLVGGFALHTFVTLTYRAPQTVEYAMPAYVALALLVGQVGKWAGGQVGKWTSGRILVIAVTLVVGIFNFAFAWPSFRDLARRDDAREYAESLLGVAPEGAIVLSNWDWATPMWYLQQVEGLRSDVMIKYVAPQGASLAQNWVDAIAQHAGESPVVVVSYFEPQYWGLPHRFEPLGPAFTVRTEPRDELPPGLTPLNVDLGGQIRLLGYALDSGELTLYLGRPASLTLAWTPLVPLEGDVALFAHLLREGKLVGQGSDRRHTVTGYRPGQVVLDRFLVYPVVGTMPGEVQLTVGAYRPGAPRLSTDGGADYVTLTTLNLRPADFSPITGRPQRVPFDGGPTLVGVDWDTTIRGQLRLYLHWQSHSGPTTLETAIRRGDEILAQAQVYLTEKGYVSSVYDLPWDTGPLVLTTDARAIGPWGLARDRLPLPTLRPGERYVPLGGEMVLMNTVVDKQGTLSPGDRLRYDLRLVATRPLLRDRIISVSLVGLKPDGSEAWRASPSDGVPALGAIPTFKWIHGSTVLDRHRLTVPGDVPDGLANTWLRVYDHYTQAILPPLDPRLLRQGLSIPLDVWTVGEPSGE
jgi:hypothetical protein